MLPSLDPISKIAVNSFDTNQAILFRLLAQFFGKEKVVPFMRVIALCDGKVSEKFQTSFARANPGREGLQSWAEKNRCLFTVIDTEDNPKVVIEIIESFSNFITTESVEHQVYLQPLLKELGINYLTISSDEIEEIIDPNSTLDFYHWLKYSMAEILSE